MGPPKSPGTVWGSPWERGAPAPHFWRSSLGGEGFTQSGGGVGPAFRAEFRTHRTTRWPHQWTIFSPTFSLLLATLATALIASPGIPRNTGPAIAPEAPVILYDGKSVTDLSAFYTWLANHAYEDPNRVFTIVDRVDGAPAIRISGQDWGGLVTRQRFSRYKLLMDFRWGAVTWGVRKERARNSGILIHCFGEDGNSLPTYRAPWMASIEYEILEGRTGDVLLVGGHDRTTGERVLPRATMRAQPGKSVWDPQGTPREFVSKQGALHWFGIDPELKDFPGARGRQDVERPAGEWNRVEAHVDRDGMLFFLNGVKVMEISRPSLTEGRLLIQSEGAEVFIRRFELHPLGKLTS